MDEKQLENPSRRRLFKNLFRASLLTLIGKGIFNASYAIASEKIDIFIKDLPSSFDGFRLSFLTDLHSSFIVTEDFLRESAEMAMSHNPDVILLGGDFISGGLHFSDNSTDKVDPAYMGALFKSMSSLKAPMGIYAVLGNHEHWCGEETINNICDGFTNSMGVKWLRDSHVVLKKDSDEIALCGIDDYWHNGSVFESVKGIDDSMVKILLSHNPDVNEEIDLMNLKIDLILSGHTHGGQVDLPLIGSPYMPSGFGQKYKSGLVQDGERQTYISRGVGTLVAPVRFNADPEVSLITLRKK